MEFISSTLVGWGITAGLDSFLHTECIYMLRGVLAMKRIPSITVLYLAFGFVSFVLAQPIAERSMPYSEYWPSIMHRVTINVSGPDGTVHIEEIPPTEWTIDAVQNGGKIVNGVITWDLNLQDGISSIIEYSVTPPAKAIGDAVFSGNVGNLEIGGMTKLSLTSQSNRPLGIFQNHKDLVGEICLTYDATFNSQTGEYQVRSGKAPEGWIHLVYSELSGPIQIQAKLKAECPTAEPGPAAFLIMVDDISIASPPLYMAYFRSTGQFKGKRRISFGQPLTVTNWVQLNSQEAWVRLTRDGTTLNLYYFDENTQKWILYDTREIELIDPIIVGLSAWSPIEHEMRCRSFLGCGVETTESIIFC